MQRNLLIGTQSIDEKLLSSILEKYINPINEILEKIDLNLKKLIDEPNALISKQDMQGINNLKVQFNTSIDLLNKALKPFPTKLSPQDLLNHPDTKNRTQSRKLLSVSSLEKLGLSKKSSRLNEIAEKMEDIISYYKQVNTYDIKIDNTDTEILTTKLRKLSMMDIANRTGAIISPVVCKSEEHVSAVNEFNDLFKDKVNVNFSTNVKDSLKALQELRDNLITCQINFISSFEIENNEVQNVVRLTGN